MGCGGGGGGDRRRRISKGELFKTYWQRKRKKKTTTYWLQRTCLEPLSASHTPESTSSRILARRTNPQARRRLFFNVPSDATTWSRLMSSCHPLSPRAGIHSLMVRALLKTFSCEKHSTTSSSWNNKTQESLLQRRKMVFFRSLFMSEKVFMFPRCFYKHKVGLLLLL